MKFTLCKSIFLLISFGISSISSLADPETGNSNQTIIRAKGALIGTELKPVEDVVITLERGRIVDISFNQEARPGMNREYGGINAIDLSCCFLLPGLIDTQTHLESQPDSPPKTVRLSEWTDASFALVAMQNARRTLMAGFTTIRDMGHSGDSVYAVRRAIEKGLIPGPRMQIAGEVIRPTGGELRKHVRPDVENLMRVDAICDGPYDCKRAVRAAVARGATTIKVETKQDLSAHSASQFDIDELMAIKEAAHALGVKATASAFSTHSMNLPLRAGFDAVVHGTFANEQTFELLRQKQSFYIPTLQAAEVVYELATDDSTPFDDDWRKENIAIYHGMVSSFKRALAADVRIAFGTDAGWRTHGSNAGQLLQMAELGMSPAQALRSATVDASQAMGWMDRVGALEVGLFADFMVTRLNPLQNLETVTAPVMVIKNGEIVFEDNSF